MSFIKVLTDVTKGIEIRNWALTSEDVPSGEKLPAWKIAKRTLRGGPEDGVELIDVDSGAMTFTVIPTRGFSIWRGQVGDTSLGWDAPVKNILHPRSIDLSERNGLGWLKGFGGWIVRCGMASIGPPCTDGAESLTLHGRVDYLSATYVEIRYEDTTPPRLVIRGALEEQHAPTVKLRLWTEISIEIGTSSIVQDDTVTNIGDFTQEMQMLYHMNFGPPLLERDADLIAPINRIAPRDARAAEASSDQWTKFYGSQRADYTEQVYLMELHADNAGNTAVMLRAPNRSAAAMITFNVRELPYFVLWKNEASTGEGYVTGLEPATSYPFPRPIERSAGRVPNLHHGESRHMRIRIDILSSRQSVERAEQGIRALALAPAVFSHNFI